MIDGSVDADFAALERTDSLKADAGSASPRVRRGVLATLPSRPKEWGSGELREAEASAAVEVPAPSPAPAAHLRMVRLGVAAVVVLVIYWLWIRQRRKVR